MNPLVRLSLKTEKLHFHNSYRMTCFHLLALSASRFEVDKKKTILNHALYNAWKFNIYRLSCTKQAIKLNYHLTPCPLHQAVELPFADVDPSYPPSWSGADKYGGRAPFSIGTAPAIQGGLWRRQDSFGHCWTDNCWRSNTWPPFWMIDCGVTVDALNTGRGSVYTTYTCTVVISRYSFCTLCNTLDTHTGCSIIKEGFP